MTDINLKNYLIKRKWVITDVDFEESLEITKSNSVLNYEEKEEFIAILKKLLPPALLDVIIFDGENVLQILNDDGMDDLTILDDDEIEE